VEQDLKETAGAHYLKCGTYVVAAELATRVGTRVRPSITTIEHIIVALFYAYEKERSLLSDMPRVIRHRCEHLTLGSWDEYPELAPNVPLVQWPRTHLLEDSKEIKIATLVRIQYGTPKTMNS